MKSSGSSAFVNQLLVGLLVTIGFGGSIGLGTVWMRHRISVVADTNAALVRQISDLERHIADTSALVEEAMSSDVLRSQNDAMRLGLVAMSQTQIVPVLDDPVSRLVARANQRAFESERPVTAKPVGIRLNLQPTPRVEDAAASAVAHDTGTGFSVRQSGNRPSPAIRGELIKLAFNHAN